MNIETIFDTTDDICALCQQELPKFLAYEKAAFTLGVLWFPEIANHLLDCDECSSTADEIWLLMQESA